MGSEDRQGGKQFGKLKTEQGLSLDEVNKIYSDDEHYQETYSDLHEKLESFKQLFMRFDTDHSGSLSLFEIKMMMEKLGQPKTHLELKKMIKEVDREDSGSISYNDFLYMMLGKASSVLKLILMFEKVAVEKPKAVGVAPRRSIVELP